ncbi:hypothetical protein HELRODRAFT_91662, partial [Helobdella robusta]|uniref:Uncharacterized protein n=1 Tax=Helobdella robusta TaxID=6412 RepID=T1G873_HELRO
IQLQQLAVSCIQKNVRKLMFVRHWPWWKLYTKVKPVLNVLRTEEELKDKEVRNHHHHHHHHANDFIITITIIIIIVIITIIVVTIINRLK